MRPCSSHSPLPASSPPFTTAPRRAAPPPPDSSSEVPRQHYLSAGSGHPFSSAPAGGRGRACRGPYDLGISQVGNNIIWSTVRRQSASSAAALAACSSCGSSSSSSSAYGSSAAAVVVQSAIATIVNNNAPGRTARRRVLAVRASCAGWGSRRASTAVQRYMFEAVALPLRCSPRQGGVGQTHSCHRRPDPCHHPVARWPAPAAAGWGGGALHWASSRCRRNPTSSNRSALFGPSWMRGSLVSTPSSPPFRAAESQGEPSTLGWPGGGRLVPGAALGARGESGITESAGH